MSTVYELLGDNGRFIGTCLPYQEKNDFVQHLIRNNLDGSLNPDGGMIEATAKKIGFKEVTIVEILTGRKTYPVALFMNFRK